jgi:hypothetical protein
MATFDSFDVNAAVLNLLEEGRKVRMFIGHRLRE